MWDETKAKKGEDAPKKTADHACVTGDTKISTSEGELSILYLENCGLGE